VQLAFRPFIPTAQILPPKASRLICPARAVRFNTMSLLAVLLSTRENAAMVRRLLASVAPIAALVAVLFAAGPAYAVGYWNLPGNTCQCWGYGWGAGHHACFVLGPITHNGAFAHNEVRLPYAPQPPYTCYGCDSYNYDFRQPSQFAPIQYQTVPQVVEPGFNEPTPEMTSPTLAPDALPMPEAPAPSRPLFEAPVEP
jgi:hypothetical protein